MVHFLQPYRLLFLIILTRALPWTVALSALQAEKKFSLEKKVMGLNHHNTHSKQNKTSSAKLAYSRFQQKSQIHIYLTFFDRWMGDRNIGMR